MNLHTFKYAIWCRSHNTRNLIYLSALLAKQITHNISLLKSRNSFPLFCTVIWSLVNEQRKSKKNIERLEQCVLQNTSQSIWNSCSDTLCLETFKPSSSIESGLRMIWQSFAKQHGFASIFHNILTTVKKKTRRILLKKKPAK